MDDFPPGEYAVALDTTPADVPPLSTAEEIDALLNEHGIIAPAELVYALDALIDNRGFRHAARALRHLSEKIPQDTAAGVALRRVISGEQEPLRELAARANVSHVAVIKAEKRIRKWTGYQKRHL